MFDLTTRALLEHFTQNRPSSESGWYGPWTTILTQLFPSAQGHVVTPQQTLWNESTVQHSIPDLVIEVLKMTSPPLNLRTVLIVEIRNTQHWPSGISALDVSLGRQLDMAYSGSAVGKVYWIGVIGPHWRYGEKEDDGQKAEPLIEWHDTTHDQSSFMDMQALAELVKRL